MLSSQHKLKQLASYAAFVLNKETHVEKSQNSGGVKQMTEGRSELSLPILLQSTIVY